ncbi:hypothetical protein HID58_048647, partial [Brassica napus]
RWPLTHKKSKMKGLFLPIGGAFVLADVSEIQFLSYHQFEEESMKHVPFDPVNVCELHPQGVVLIRFKDHKDAQKCTDAMNGMQREIHASLDSGSVNHAAVRDFDSEAVRLDQFAAELEAE